MAMTLPRIPAAVPWRNGMVLEPSHFTRSDQRAAGLSHLAGLVSDPWPWGFLSIAVDEVALASSQLRLDCEGVFPDGEPFREARLASALPAGRDGDQIDFTVSGREDATLTLSAEAGASTRSLPAARLVYRGGVWAPLPDWSPPAILIGPDHPLRAEIAHQLGALAALAAGFMATLRLPGAEERPAVRMLGQVAAALAQGVGVLEALLAAPAVSPGRLGIEALRLALGVRGAAGIFQQLDEGWDAFDQRGSIRRLLFAAESTASGIGLPFRANVFRPTESDVHVVEGVPREALLLAIEASRPADLVAARAWFEGAALAAPDRIQEAFNRRVAGCARRPLDRDPLLGVSSGPLLALYQVEFEPSWRGDATELALGAKTPPPHNASFSILLAESVRAVPARPSAPLSRASSFASASWASGTAGEAP